MPLLTTYVNYLAMAQTNSLIDALKRALKTRGITYAKVANELGMSEANIKRMFSERRFYLSVFDDICQLANIEISDLAKQIERDRQNLEQLTEEQEQELVSDSRLLLICFLVINDVTFEEILESYHTTRPETIRYLVRLDKLKLIELMPNNRVKLLIAPNFSWRNNGPIQQFFTRYIQRDFLNHSFDQDGELLNFISGIMTSASRDTLILRLKKLTEEFNQHNNTDAKSNFNERYVTSMILGIRSWKPKAFEKFMVKK